MPNTGIEPATLLSLARHSNQLSYAAANWFLKSQRLIVVFVNDKIGIFESTFNILEIRMKDCNKKKGSWVQFSKT